MNRYTYKGRHRAASHTTQRVAAVAAAVALPAITVGTAHAEPNWDPIIHCESGGNPAAKNPGSTASGLFQFINGTWAAYGGLEFAPTARQASAAEQYEVANRAYAREGFGPWAASKHCWNGKTAAKAEIKVEAPAVKTETRKPSPRPRVVHADPKPEAVKKHTPKHAAVPVGQPTMTGHGEYTVQPGDTLTGIAIDHGVKDWHTVYNANRDVVESPNWIWPGERLTLKAGVDVSIRP